MLSIFIPRSIFRIFTNLYYNSIYSSQAYNSDYPLMYDISIFASLSHCLNQLIELHTFIKYTQPTSIKNAICSAATPWVFFQNLCFLVRPCEMVFSRRPWIFSGLFKTLGFSRFFQICPTIVFPVVPFVNSVKNFARNTEMCENNEEIRDFLQDNQQFVSLFPCWYLLPPKSLNSCQLLRKFALGFFGVYIGSSWVFQFYTVATLALFITSL